MANNENRKNLKRTVRLGVYGDVSMKLLEAVKKFAQTSSFGTRLDTKSFAACSPSRSPDNEIILNVYEDDMYNPVRNTVFTEKPNKAKNDAAVRKWLANVVKGTVKFCINPHADTTNIHQAAIAGLDGWCRNSELKVKVDNIFETENADNVFTVSQAYALYESLKGRRLKDSRFAPGVLEQIVGKPFDPIRTEIETFRREETERIETEFKTEWEAISKWYYNKCREIEREAHLMRDNAEKNKNKKLIDMNAEIDASLAEACDQVQQQASAAA